jgi:hypothetical protein
MRFLDDHQHFYVLLIFKRAISRIYTSDWSAVLAYTHSLDARDLSTRIEGISTGDLGPESWHTHIVDRIQMIS